MESTAATTGSSPWWLCLKPAQSAWSSLMVSVKHNVNWSLLQLQTCNLLLAAFCLQPPKAPSGIRCHRRSTRTCLFPRTVATAGRGHCGVLTITAYWTQVASLWLWRLSEKDKSKPSSTTFSDRKSGGQGYQKHQMESLVYFPSFVF